MSNPHDNAWIEQSIDAEAATNPNAPADPIAADENAAVLAETWAAFSGLLGKSQASPGESALDESALVSAVLARVARRERKRRQWQLGAVGLAAAATLLIAVSLVRYSRDGAEVALVAQGDAATAGGNVASTPVLDPMLDWDDAALSQSLTNARLEAHQLESNWRQPTDALANFQNRLDALQQEIEDSSL